MHQADEEVGKALTEQYGVSDWPRVSDPELRLYHAFGLEKGGLLQIMGPKSVLRGTGVTVTGGHTLRKPVGSIWQMPGTFVLERGRVVAEFRHRSVADRPDYLGLIDGAAVAKD